MCKPFKIRSVVHEAFGYLPCFAAEGTADSGDGGAGVKDEF